jgi:urease accessory protein
MVLDHDTTSARISLVPEGALLLAGDHVELDVEVTAGARLDLVEPGGTVAFPMHGGTASWDVRISVAQGATLTWAGEPLIVSAGADVRRSTHIRCAAGGRVVLRETLVLGRYAEQPGSVRQSTSAADGRNRPILVEELDLDAASAATLLGGGRVVSTVLAIGVAPVEPSGPLRFDLDAHAAVQWRWLGMQTHESRLDAAWRSAVEALVVLDGARTCLIQ